MCIFLSKIYAQDFLKFQTHLTCNRFSSIYIRNRFLTKNRYHFCQPAMLVADAAGLRKECFLILPGGVRSVVTSLVGNVI